jgi:hypothetical protein
LDSELTYEKKENNKKEEGNTSRVEHKPEAGEKMATCTTPIAWITDSVVLLGLLHHGL